MTEFGMKEKYADENKVCGYKVPSIKDVGDKLKLTKDEYREFQEKLGGFLHDSKKRSADKWYKFNDALGGTIHEIIH